MEYREIVSVTGLPGLYQLVATKNDGAIVRNLADKSTRFISARIHNVTPLESIEIYTISENIRLHELFSRMKESTTPPLKGVGKATDARQITDYFREVYPDLDFDRVYLSDMKRILKWYEVLESHDLLHFESLLEETSETAASEAEEAAPPTMAEAEAPEEKKDAGAKTKAKKKASAGEEKETDIEEKTSATEKKPRKKASEKPGSKSKTKHSEEKEGE